MHVLNQIKLRRVVILAVVAALSGLICFVAVGMASAPVTTQVTDVTKIDGASPVGDIIEFVQGRPHWDQIAVTGHGGTNGAFDTFTVQADWATGYYVSRAGDAVFGLDATGKYACDLASGVVRAFADPPAQTAAQQEALNARMEAAEALDPTLARDGEILLPNSLNDMVNPSYWMRKELGCMALTVTNLGPVEVAGRSAVHLRATFPEGLAKEDHEDVYVDIESGILLGVVVAPSAGGIGFEQWVDSVDLAPKLSPESFSRSAAVELQ